jgi:23S rRNA (guanosine2251-2'-O)-methyltransferase
MSDGEIGGAGAQSEWICGRGSITEALRGGRAVNTLLYAAGAQNIGHILALAKERGAVTKEADRRKLDHMSGGANHQGVMLSLAAHSYATVEDILARAHTRAEEPFLLFCDEIEDPQNLGAMLRTAEAVGVHGVVLPQRRAVPLTWAVNKVSAGAAEHVLVARVPNLAQCMETLKKDGIWFYGADMEGENYRGRQFTGGKALVIGAEGHGLRDLVKRRCDALLALPMRGKIQSLNASVAAGVLLYAMMGD